MTQIGAAAVDSEVKARSPVPGYAWYVLSVLTVTNIFAAVDRFMMGILVVPLRGALDLTDTQLGLLQGLGFALLYCIAGLPLGRLADRMDRRLLISLGCAVWTLATAACAFATSFNTLFLARIFVGLGEATLLPAALSLLSAYFPRERIGLSTGIFVMGSSLGKSTAFIGGGLLLAMFAATGGLVVFGMHFEPWQGLFLAAAAPGILTTVLTLALREPARSAPKGGEQSGVLELWRYVARHGAAFPLYLLAAICVITVAHVFAAWAPSFFVRRFDLPIAEAATIVGLVALTASPIGALLGGYITDRMMRGGSKTGPLTVMVIALCLIAPASAVAFYFSDNLALSIGAYAFAQAMALASGPQCYAGIQVMTPLRHRGLMSAVFLALTSLVALGLGPTIIGLFSDYVFGGDDSSALGTSMVTTIGLLTIAGVATAIWARRPVSAIVAETES